MPAGRNKKQTTRHDGNAIGTCAGEWRKRRDGDWQFYELADLHG